MRAGKKFRKGYRGINLCGLNTFVLLEAKLARFYGWHPKEIEELTIGEMAEYAYAIDVLLTEENARLLHIISFPHVEKGMQKKLFKYYVGDQVSGAPGDARAMAMKYHKYLKKKDQKWPKQLSKN